MTKGLVSDILNYKKGLSKEIISKLADTFKLSHEACNRRFANFGLVAPTNARRLVWEKYLQEGELQFSSFNYQDVRDDKVYTYFNMNENETLAYYIQLNAAYLGKYFLQIMLLGNV